jgi:hypothetical protein
MPKLFGDGISVNNVLKIPKTLIMYSAKISEFL